MNYKINTTVTDEDYLDYNLFVMTQTPFGKKQLSKSRLFLTLLYIAVWLVFVCFATTLFFVELGFTVEAVVLLFLLTIVATVIFAIALIVSQISFARSNKAFVKKLLKLHKKQGKMPYSSSADFEFLDEIFIETTPSSKSEIKYSTIESVSIVADKVIYLHANNILAYILPVSCFETKEQYDEFLEFIKTKCEKVDIYKK